MAIFEGIVDFYSPVLKNCSDFTSDPAAALHDFPNTEPTRTKCSNNKQNEFGNVPKNQIPANNSEHYFS